MTAITHNGLGIYAVPEAETLKLTQTLIGYCIYTLLATVRIMKPKYLVRPNDFSILDLDESNGCYRGWSKNIKPCRFYQTLTL